MDKQLISHGGVILGVDTHLDVHVGAVISATGKLLRTLSVATNEAGYLKLLAWAGSLGPVRYAGVEGTGTYGAGLARVLREHGIEVWEVNRPDRARRRRQDKSDPTDAENAARAVLAGTATAIPKVQCGAAEAEAMRVISVARRSAAKAQAINQLRVLLVSVPQDIRERLWKGQAGRMRRGMRPPAFIGCHAPAANIDGDTAPTGQALADVGRSAEKARCHAGATDG
ncbi:transposase [Neisseriaceae bacterium JH1-16]|nr:transposase [Neisseriaceae bacterium JH1-16]